MEIMAAKADDVWLDGVRDRVAARGAPTWEEVLLLLLHIEWQTEEMERLASERDDARDELAAVTTAIALH